MTGKDAYWFPHDANAREDPKLVALRAKHGWAGIGLWWALVELLRDQVNYRMNLDKPWEYVALGKQLDFDDAGIDVREFIDDAMEYKLLKREEGAIFSPSLCRRMKKWDERKEQKRRAGKKGAEARWGKQNEDSGKAKEGQSDGTAIAPPKRCNGKYSIEEESRGEEKREERKDTQEKQPPPLQPPLFEKSDKQPTTEERQALALLKDIDGWPFEFETDLEKLRELAVDCPDIDILEQVKRYRDYKVDNPLKKNSNPRLQLRNWMEKAQEWSTEDDEPIPPYLQRKRG